MTYSSLPTKITLMCFSKNFNPSVKERSFKSQNPNALYSPQPTFLITELMGSPKYWALISASKHKAVFSKNKKLSRY